MRLRRLNDGPTCLTSRSTLNGFYLRALLTALDSSGRHNHSNERRRRTQSQRHGHVVYESSQFRAGIRASAVGKVEYKRGVDAGVIHQGLFYLAWLMDHRSEFERLVRDRLGPTAAAQVLWSGPRLICIAGGFTRYDVHAVREHRRSIDLVRYRYFGSDLLGLETVASVAGRTPTARMARRPAAGAALGGDRCVELGELAVAVDEVLLGLGDGVNRIQRKQYRAYQRLRNFACVCPPQKTKLLVYLKADPKQAASCPGSPATSPDSATTEPGTWRCSCAPGGIWSAPRSCSARATRQREPVDGRRCSPRPETRLWRAPAEGHHVG